jgi:hypothetical protein
LLKWFAILIFLAKEEKMSSNSLTKKVGIFGKLAKMLAARAYMRAGCERASAPARSAASLHLSLSVGQASSV